MNFHFFTEIILKIIKQTAARNNKNQLTKQSGRGVELFEIHEYASDRELFVAGVGSPLTLS
jgi:hypothetical protein